MADCCTGNSSGGHGEEAPSSWVLRFSGLIRPGGRALDLACGRGRHARLLRDQGCSVVALDRDAGALAQIAILTSNDLNLIRRLDAQRKIKLLGMK